MKHGRKVHGDLWLQTRLRTTNPRFCCTGDPRINADLTMSLIFGHLFCIAALTMSSPSKWLGLAPEGRSLLQTCILGQARVDDDWLCRQCALRYQDVFALALP